MITLTNEQETVIRWYIDMLYTYESDHNEWAKANKEQWINSMYKSFLINDEVTFQIRYDKIIKLYNKKDETFFVFPFLNCLNDELQYLYKT